MNTRGKENFSILLYTQSIAFTPRSQVLVWPRRLQIGVYYAGWMPRSRWLAMRLAPLFGLTVLPALLLLATYPFRIDYFWQQVIVLVILVNSLGAGGDLVAALIVARQVPRGGELGIWQGRACWRLDSPGPRVPFRPGAA